MILQIADIILEKFTNPERFVSIDSTPLSADISSPPTIKVSGIARISPPMTALIFAPDSFTFTVLPTAENGISGSLSNISEAQILRIYRKDLFQRTRHIPDTHWRAEGISYRAF